MRQSARKDGWESLERGRGAGEVSGPSCITSMAVGNHRQEETLQVIRMAIQVSVKQLHILITVRRSLANQDERDDSLILLLQ